MTAGDTDPGGTVGTADMPPPPDQRIRSDVAERRRRLTEEAERRRSEIAEAFARSQRRLEAAADFSRKWAQVTAERAEAQSFWNDLFSVFGLDRFFAGVEFERPARRSDTGRPGRIDVFWAGKLLAEHKSAGFDLDAAFAQADAYEIDDEDEPRLTVVSDFQRFAVRDNRTGRSTVFPLAALPENLGWFAPLTQDEMEGLVPDIPVDLDAAQKVAELHDALAAAGYEGHNLGVLLTRLIFCFFADDTRVWPKGAFDRYLESIPASFAGPAISQLFDVLNTPVDRRSPALAPELAVFPYINGGLFEENIPLPYFTPEMAQMVLDVSAGVDWSKVSPAVFGSMFQGVMDASQRHDLGAHYTSERSILRLIRPLFLDDLYARLDSINTIPGLERLWNEIAGWKFLDPAAGCGNFLVVAYRELRRFEKQLMAKIEHLAGDDQRWRLRFPWIQNQQMLDFGNLSRLGVEQFYGIEIEEWPAQIATVAMWIADHLANLELEERFGGHQARLPIENTVNMTVGNALRIDWAEILKPDECTFILGNPPYMGTAWQSPEQKEDMRLVWAGTKGAGNLDYVTAWFNKAARYIDGTGIKAAFVATNSITQGQQPAILWADLKQFDIHIDFAHRSFAWWNEAKDRAAVHVVIIGFSQGRKSGSKRLWYYPDLRGEGDERRASVINAYLLDAPEVLITARRSPLVPTAQKMDNGSKPADGGHLILSPAEANELHRSDPVAARYLRPLVGAAELIQGRERWCLWLVDASPADLRSSPELRRRLAAVRDSRLASTKAATRRDAATPALFQEIRQPSSTYLAVPEVSSQTRSYIPMKLLGPDVIATNKIQAIHNADLVTFGVLSSRVFAVWAHGISGRLKSDISISAELTYNNFPWPDLDPTKRSSITEAAQAVLDARDSHPGASLADLYDSLAMPPDLVQAHRNLDRVVLACYGLRANVTDDRVLELLLNRYVALAGRG